MLYLVAEYLHPAIAVLVVVVLVLGLDLYPERDALDALGAAELCAEAVEADEHLGVALPVPLEADRVKLGGVDLSNASRSQFV